jgi:uncharacterized protein (DUF427 family)
VQGHEIQLREDPRQVDVIVGDVVIASSTRTLTPWSSPTPIDGVREIAGRICLYSERADHVVDGEPVERPVSPWSPTS